MVYLIIRIMIFSMVYFVFGVFCIIWLWVSFDHPIEARWRVKLYQGSDPVNVNTELDSKQNAFPSCIGYIDEQQHDSKVSRKYPKRFKGSITSEYYVHSTISNRQQHLFRHTFIVTAKKCKYINKIKYLVHLQLRGLNWVHFYGSNFLSLLALLPHIFLSFIILPKHHPCYCRNEHSDHTGCDYEC